ncbi:endonuclease/exonuclease/phosphatase family protein [Amycolatopsis suaedae]|uniref:Endonuclease/exonuclease/phosphatase family protein n=1 Tax=Amycolatopsis suaedae TaxID=2510978 RepID=A0A4Q7JDV8_9PSEU|nr:endonuclease/exonuclease/phosphatase family protein [Amycolatopsis suaedae]
MTAATLVALTTAALLTPAAAHAEPEGFGRSVRFATFNASLNRARAGQLLADLSAPGNEQAAKAAEVIQRNRPDVLLVNEFDYVAGNAAADAFRANYLRVGQRGAQPIDYPYVYTAPSNTGVPTGFDLDRNGTVGGGNDAHGFGEFEGQYGMLVLSRFPIDTAGIRTFRNFRWKDMPGALLPDDPATPAPADWYGPDALNVLRLSSKSHWDLPVRVGRQVVHFLVAHPTPPVFDGPEDRNGRRNHDETRFWADYVTPGRAGYVYDDAGRRGGLPSGAKFVVAGDYNADPHDGDGVPGGIERLLHAPRVIDPRPDSRGAVVAAREQGGANTTHCGPARLDTGDFADTTPGNMRVDYVLPSWGLVPWRAEVFWPVPGSPLARLNDTSDHHLVRVDALVFGA